MSVNCYKDLKVWQVAMDVVVQIYGQTQSFPQHERYGLCSQIQRAAVSIPSNIAEGHARDSTAEFLHHLSFALGSLAEVETQLLLAERLGYVEPASAKPLHLNLLEVGRMLRGLQKALKLKL